MKNADKKIRNAFGSLLELHHNQTKIQAKIQALRKRGADDFRDGRVIDAFYDIPNIDHNEWARAHYEIGWRAAQKERENHGS